MSIAKLFNEEFPILELVSISPFLKAEKKKEIPSKPGWLPMLLTLTLVLLNSKEYTQNL